MHRWSSASEDDETYCTRIAAVLDAKLSFGEEDEGQGAGKRGGATKPHYTSFYVDSCNEDEEDLIDFSQDVYRCEVLNVSSPTSCPRLATPTTPLTPPTSTNTTNGASACIDNGSRECCDYDDGWNSDPEDMPPLYAPSVSTGKFNITFSIITFL